MPRTRMTSDSAAAAALDRWLAAEQSGLDADAEAALADVLGALPQPAPRAGFADRVLVRAISGSRRRWLGRLVGRGSARRPRLRLSPVAAAAWPVMAMRHRPEASPAGRQSRPPHGHGARAASPGGVSWLVGAGALGLAATASLLLAALGLAPALRTVLRRASLSGTLQAGIDSIMSLGRWFAGLVSLADKLLLVARAVAEPLASPPMAVLAAACLLVSVLAMRFLCNLIQSDRRWVYVDPI